MPLYRHAPLPREPPTSRGGGRGRGSGSGGRPLHAVLAVSPDSTLATGAHDATGDHDGHNLVGVGSDGLCGLSRKDRRARVKDAALLSLLLVVVALLNCLLLWEPGHLHVASADEEFGDRVLNRVYFAATTVSTVGYGDIYPLSARARLLVLTQQVVVLIGGVVALRALLGRLVAPRGGGGGGDPRGGKGASAFA